jgi:hypothetical protein
MGISDVSDYVEGYLPTLSNTSLGDISTLIRTYSGLSTRDAAFLGADGEMRVKHIHV